MPHAAALDLAALKADYDRDGFLSGIPLLTAEEAAEHRATLESAEAKVGPLHYCTKVHTILRSPLALATMPRALDIVEALIGPDILLYNVTYIIKEAGAESFVSWHQDLTYWGFSHDDQVTLWLALSTATAESGCMRMVPGSHTAGVMPHEVEERGSNVLLQGQTVRNIDEAASVLCPLRPGEASFHHGWTLHASLPNVSADRRIGLNIQYVAPHMRQTKHDLDTAILVRGQDRYRHFGSDVPATADLDPAALTRRKELDDHYVSIAGRA